MSEKLSEINRLQLELNRREDEDADDISETLKGAVATLEMENNNLKVGNILHFKVAVIGEVS